MADQGIKAVMFDHGGVLTRGGEKGTNEKAASRAMGLDFVIEIPDINEALKRGAITNAEYVDEINRRFPDAPTRLTMGMWDDIYAALERDPLAYEFAERCRQAGYRVGDCMTITSYDNDPRVRKVSEYQFHVVTDDEYDVSCWTSETAWSIHHSIGSRAMREADLRSREDAEAWAKQDNRGPFPSAEIALYELLGNPQS